MIHPFLKGRKLGRYANDHWSNRGLSSVELDGFHLLGPFGTVGVTPAVNVGEQTFAGAHESSQRCKARGRYETS